MARLAPPLVVPLARRSEASLAPPQGRPGQPSAASAEQGLAEQVPEREVLGPELPAQGAVLAVAEQVAVRALVVLVAELAVVLVPVALRPEVQAVVARAPEAVEPAVAARAPVMAE